MYLRQILMVVISLSLIGCAHVNRYEGEDAVSIYNHCASIGHTQEGQQYEAYIAIYEVDDKFTGSGNSCPKIGYTYKIAPGERKLKLIASFSYTNFPKSTRGLLDIMANLEVGKEYGLKTAFDGSVIRAKLIDTKSGKVIAEGETQKITEAYRSNSVLMAIPFIVK